MRDTKIYFLLISILLISPSLTKSNEKTCTPDQIRLSLGDLYSTTPEADDIRLPSEILNDNQAYLVWQTDSDCDFLVQISEISNFDESIRIPVSFQTAYSHKFSSETNEEIYHSTAYTVLIDGLEYERSYEYEILDASENTISGPYTFKLPTPNITESPRKVFLAGDTDNTEKGGLTIDRIKSEFAKNPDNYAGWIHLGDVAYNLQDENAKRGDDFFNSIQDITASLPFIMTPGNHDKFDHWKLLNFRLRNPLYNMTHNQYYSFNLQGIHFVSINFEHYNSLEPEKQEKMLDWIEKDLEKSNSEERRALWPWIVVITHAPIYCTYNDPEGPENKKCYNYYSDMTVWDELFHKHSVDLTVSGHLHSYERMKPIYKNQSVAYDEETDDNDHNIVRNPQATVYIVEGTGGNKGYVPKDYEAEGYGVFVNKDAGFGTIHAGKSSSGEFMLTYEHHSSKTGKVIDFMHIIKSDIAIEKIHEDSHFILIVIAVSGTIGLIIGILVLKKWKFGKIAEDRIPLNSSPIKSTRLRYNRPGERSVAMVDL